MTEKANNKIRFSNERKLRLHSHTCPILIYLLRQHSHNIVQCPQVTEPPLI